MRTFAITACLFLAFAACKGTDANTSTGDGGNVGTTPASYDRPGFETTVIDDRLWVFRAGSKEYADFQKNGLPTISAGRVPGPNGLRGIKAPDAATIDAYLQAK